MNIYSTAFATVVAGTILSVSLNASAADSEFLAFVVKNAHDRGFKQCDEAIRQTFSLAGGTDIRVVTDSFPGFEDDTLKITAAFGEPGDAILTEAEFRKRGKKCLATTTTLVTTPKSCTAYAAEMAAFKFDAETVGVVFTKNAGGVSMLLNPVGSGCAAVFQKSNSY